MLLVIDTGNTQSVFAIYDAGRLVGQWRLATDTKRSADEYAVFLHQVMQLQSLSLRAIENVVIGSVVPGVMFALKDFSRKYLEVEPLVVSERDFTVPMEVQIDYPSELGADRLINAYAAYNRCKQAVIVVDFGTATTFDVVSAAGQYLGGVIAPGVLLSLDALHRAAAKLPTLQIAVPVQVTGKNTVSAMQSGMYYGYLSLVDGIVDRLRKELSGKARIFATGGLASLYSKHSQSIEEVIPDLTIQGLADLFYYYEKRKDKCA